MDTKIFFLDSSVLVRISSDSSLASTIVGYINYYGYTIVVGTLSLVELYRRPGRKWSDIAEFLSSIPFCIARNPDGILDAEVATYPAEVILPMNFCSADYGFSKAEIKRAIEANMDGRIAQFDDAYRQIQHSTWKQILASRDQTPPDQNNKYSERERQVFLQTSIWAMVHDFHPAFLQGLHSSGEVIDIKCFKSVYIQALAVFIEYYIQRKDGKASDIGDFFQLSYVPYVEFAVLDNERTDLIRRINQTKLFSRELRACNISQFKAVVARGDAPPSY